MTKLRLSKVVKARVDEQTKQDVEQLTVAFNLEDEAVTLRRALRYFIAANRSALPQRTGGQMVAR